MIERQHVIAGPAVDRAVVRTSSPQPVVEVRTGEALNIQERVDPRPPGVLRPSASEIDGDRDARRRSSVVGGVDPGPPIQCVVAESADEHVIVAAAVERVVASQG